jgi:hypothetical protein
MTRRWRIWLGLVLLLLLLGTAFLVPAVRWPVIGWLKREAFYDGMPTSYWRSQIRDYRECVIPMGSMIAVQPPQTLLNRLRESVGLQPTYLDQPAIMVAGDDAVPVLVELLEDDEETMRAEAIDLLSAAVVFAHSHAAHTALRQALKSPHRDVRWRAADCLLRRDPDDGPLLIPVFIEWLLCEDSGRRSNGSFALQKLGPAARDAIPQLLEAYRQGNSEPHAIPQLLEAYRQGNSEPHLIVDAVQAIAPEEAARAGLR